MCIVTIHIPPWWESETLNLDMIYFFALTALALPVPHSHVPLCTIPTKMTSSWMTSCLGERPELQSHLWILLLSQVLRDRESGSLQSYLNSKFASNAVELASWHTYHGNVQYVQLPVNCIHVRVINRPTLESSHQACLHKSMLTMHIIMPRYQVRWTMLDPLFGPIFNFLSSSSSWDALPDLHYSLFHSHGSGCLALPSSLITVLHGKCVLCKLLMVSSSMEICHAVQGPLTLWHLSSLHLSKTRSTAQIAVNVMVDNFVLPMHKALFIYRRKYTWWYQRGCIKYVLVCTYRSIAVCYILSIMVDTNSILQNNMSHQHMWQ